MSTRTPKADTTVSELPDRLPANLAEYLPQNPWPTEWTQFGSTVDYLWFYDVAMPKHALWPHLIDTSAFNKRMGLSEMIFTEQNGRLVGRSVQAGSELIWDETPWEWEYEHGLQNERIYRKGMLRFVRAHFRVVDIDRDRSRVMVYFGGVPRTWLGRLALKFGMGSYQQSFAKVFDQIAAAYAKGVAPPRVDPPPLLSEEALRRVEVVRLEIEREGVDEALANRLSALVQTAPDDELARIRVKPLAREWNLDPRDVTIAFLHATRKGLFALTWDVICPHCRGSRGELMHLGELPREASCDVCGIDFDATQLNSIEVSFHVQPAVRRVMRQQFCSAEPARKAHIYLQRTVAAGVRNSFSTSLPPGRYRMRVGARKEYVLLDVGDASAPREVVWRDSDGADERVSAANPVISVENSSDQPATFVVETRDQDRDALRPVDLFALQAFRDIFSQEAVATDVQLDIGTQTIVFTDVVGSTRYYETAGDAAAFAEVRRHFVKAHQFVALHRGVVVKTIGDAVMASFADAVSALRAAIDIQRYFDKENAETKLRLRVSLHTGVCLAVSLNSNIDYFGNTVNFAAKLQSMADAGQIVYSEAVERDPGVAELLRAEGYAPETLSFEKKWSGEREPARRITVS